MTQTAADRPRLLRARDVADLVGVDHQTIRRWSKLGQFPRPLCYGPRTNLWQADEVDQWLAERERRRGQEAP